MGWNVQLFHWLTHLVRYILALGICFTDFFLAYRMHRHLIPSHHSTSFTNWISILSTLAPSLSVARRKYRSHQSRLMKLKRSRSRLIVCWIWKLTNKLLFARYSLRRFSGSLVLNKKIRSLAIWLDLNPSTWRDSWRNATSSQLLTTLTIPTTLRNHLMIIAYYSTISLGILYV